MTAQRIAAADQAFYAAAVRKSVRIPSQNVSSGQVIQFPMPKAGIGCFAVATFSGTLSRTEGATVGTVNKSPWGPYNALQGISFSDYAGLQRLISLDGWQLEQRRRVQVLRQDSQLNPPGGLANPTYQSTLFAFSIPAGVASSTVTSNLNFQVLIPFSVRHNSVRGSFVFATPDGQSVLSIGIQPQVAMVASSATPSPENIVEIPYVAGATTTVSISGTLTLTYYYYDAAVGTPVPIGEISQVYELASVKNTSGLAASSISQFILPTGKTYLRLFEDLVLAGVPTSTAVSSLKFLVDSSTPTTEENLAEYLARMNDLYGQPLPDGGFIWDWFGKPWTPSQYGSLEADLSLTSTATTTAPSFRRSMRECLYVAQANAQLTKIGSVA